MKGGPWRKVDVTLPEGDDRNHYDDSGNSANHDLEAEPGEAVGIFFGLEVIDGSQYTLERSKTSSNNHCIMKIRNSDSAVAGEKEEQQRKKRPNPETSVSTSDSNEQTPSSPSDERPIDSEKPRKKQKKKKKKSKSLEKKKSQIQTNNSDDKAGRKTDPYKVTSMAVDNDDEETQENPSIQDLQLRWMSATGGVQLHERLCQGLSRQGFQDPSPIQAATLPVAIFGRRNIVGAAPTGSGKTLAFLLPIFQFLLEEQEAAVHRTLELKALILSPTRELALQIHQEAIKLTAQKSMIACLTGGLAIAKQQRVLSNRPPVIVATPGRLWDLISSRDYEHLNDLSQLRFLVIDEADRMVNQRGSFPELSNILDAVHRANPMEESDDVDQLDETESDDNQNRMLRLPGIPGEAKVAMISDEILQQLQKCRETDRQEVNEVEDEEFEKLVNNPEDDVDSTVLSLPARPPVHRQTLIFSATLTLQPSKQQGKKWIGREMGGVIGGILEKTRAKGKTKIIDLTNGSQRGIVREVVSGKSGSNDEVKVQKDAQQLDKTKYRLPPGLKLQQIKCTKLHKDSHLYAYLMTTTDGASGPSLIFCNSIAAVRRVGATLQTLGLNVRILHAQMQQRARFKAVEFLKDWKNKKVRTVVVATDVAARGLDILPLASVVHYDAARTIETFVHRAGRTARGIGEGAVGSSLSLIASGEDKFHAKIVKALNVRFEDVKLDGRLLNASQERVNLASKVASAQDTERKVHNDNQWLKETAEEAGLEIDDDMLEEGLADGDQRSKMRLKEAMQARERLRILLSQPLLTQRFGKFLSTNSAVSQRVIPEPSVVASAKSRVKRHKKKSR